LARDEMNPKRRDILKSTGLMILGGFMPGIGQSQNLEVSGQSMGTRYLLKLNTAQSVSLDDLKLEVDSILARVDSRMSLYREDSELSRFNNNRSTGWQALSGDTRQVLDGALHIQRISGGAFNPLVRPLLKHWGFGADAEPLLPRPVSPEIEVIRGVAKGRLELNEFAARKSRPDLGVDLNAIAKGYAVDQVAGMLRARGIESYMFELGGEVICGSPAGQPAPWRIGILGPRQKLTTMVRPGNAAVATSGDHLQFFLYNNRRYSHLLNPASGEPVKHRLTLVSTIMPGAMLADAWSTALMVMGPHAGWKLAREQDIAALFVVRDAYGFRELRTPGFESFEVKNI